MTAPKRGPSSNSRILATDLDGTLIPLGGCQRNVSDLATLGERLRASNVDLVFVTGRHFHSVQAAIYRLLDDWSAPYSVIHSVDPFNGDGLIDLLPRGVSEAYALNW